MIRPHKNSSNPSTERPQIILYDVRLPGALPGQTQRRLQESHQLVHTYGGDVIKSVTQKRHHPSTWGYIGYHKFRELIHEAYTLGAKLIILNQALKPKQIHHLEVCLEDTQQEHHYEKGLRIWDRVDLIINIFSQNAHTAEAKLQLEIARLEHFGPRIYGMGEELSQQGGGIGTRGLGETNTEIMKRHIASRKKILRKKLNTLAHTRAAHRTRRAKNAVKTIALVGYTNTGKSSLFQCLTTKNVYVKDRLFATLDTVSGRLAPAKSARPNYTSYNKPHDKLHDKPHDKPSSSHEKSYSPQPQLIISDTIGFIEDLPPKLIQAFRSTIEDIVEADMLLHVSDISDPDFTTKIQVVRETLTEIGAGNIPTLMVFNKIDKLPENNLLSLPHAGRELSDDYSFYISANTGEAIDALREAIVTRLHSHPLDPDPLKEAQTILTP